MNNIQLLNEFFHTTMPKNLTAEEYGSLIEILYSECHSLELTEDMKQAKLKISKDAESRFFDEIGD